MPEDLGPVRQVTTGNIHTCALTQGGVLRCWGDNFRGQLDVPTDLGPLNQVSAGSFHTCAVTTGGDLRCWGSNDEGQTGVPAGLGPVSQASAGWTHSCAIVASGAVRCWGSNAYGQVNVPSDLSGPPSTTDDCARFVADVNFPDGTVVSPGQRFIKRWRLRNCGATAWDGRYQAFRDAGSFGPASFAVAGAAGAIVEIFAEVTAPTSPGAYRTTYRLRGPGGPFGDPFWVEVRVRAAPPATYNISGRVIGPQGGLGGALITASGPQTVSTFTSADGSYRLTGLPAGSYQLTAAREGYAFGAPRTVSVPPDAGGQDFVGRAAAPPPSRQIAIMVHGWQGFEFDTSKYDCQIAKFTGPYRRNENGSAVDVPGWDRVGRQLTALGYEVYLANWTSSFWRTIRAEDAARNCLAPQIASVAGRDSDGRVLLITHSMGGLVSRAYIENASLYRGDVEALITLGTPHAGVNLNTLIKFAALLRPSTNFARDVVCLTNPGLCQLGSDEMLRFNIAHRPIRAVPYLFVGGSGGSDWLAGGWERIVNATEGRSDGIVGFRSATGYQYSFASSIPIIGKPLRDDILIVRGDNIARRYSNSVHHPLLHRSRPWYFNDTPVDACVTEFLRTRSPGACSAMREPVLNATPAQAGTQAEAFTPMQFGTLRSGEIITTTLDLEGAEAAVLLSSSNGQLSLTLTTPDGALLTPANAGQVVPGAQYSGPATPDEPPIISYRLPNPPAGRWIATIAASDVLTETTYVLFAALQSRLTLEVERPTSVAAGQPLLLRTIVRDGTTPVDGATVSASLPTPQGLQVVTLTRSAPGVYTGQITAPLDPGPHLLNVTATGATATPFARQVDELITVRASGVQRQGDAVVTPIDRDGNGRFETLRVTATFAVAAAGDHAALAALQDANGRVIALARAQDTWAAGNNVLALEFDGGEILAGGVDGPFRVVAQIVTGDGATLVADEQPLVAGLNYRATDFEPPPSRIFLPLLRR